MRSRAAAGVDAFVTTMLGLGVVLLAVVLAFAGVMGGGTVCLHRECGAGTELLATAVLVAVPALTVTVTLVGVTIRGRAGRSTWWLPALGLLVLVGFFRATVAVLG